MKDKQSWLLTHGIGIDVENGRAMEDFSLRIANGTIVSFGQGLAPNKGEKVIDLQGQYLLPGLINGSIYLEGDGSPKETLRLDEPASGAFQKSKRKRDAVFALGQSLFSGITTAKVECDVNDLDLAAKLGAEDGSLYSPHILSSGSRLACPESFKDEEKDALAKKEFSLSLEKKKKAGVDWICLDYDSVRSDIAHLKWAVSEAHKGNLSVLLRPDERSEMKELCASGANALISPKRINEAEARLLLASGMALSISLSSPLAYAYLPPLETGLSVLEKEQAKEKADELIANAKLAYSFGIPLILGNEAGLPFASPSAFCRELLFFQRFVGGDAKEVLKLATLGNAQSLGIAAKTGSIAVGKQADLLVLQENPLRGLTALWRVNEVYCAGRRFKNPSVKSSKKLEASLSSLEN